MLIYSVKQGFARFFNEASAVWVRLGRLGSALSTLVENYACVGFSCCKIVYAQKTGRSSSFYTDHRHTLPSSPPVTTVPVCEISKKNEKGRTSVFFQRKQLTTSPKFERERGALFQRRRGKAKLRVARVFYRRMHDPRHHVACGLPFHEELQG